MSRRARWQVGRFDQVALIDPSGQQAERRQSLRGLLLRHLT